MGIEDERQLAFHCPLGPDVLLVRSLVGSEQLGACFEYTVTLYSLDHDVKIDSLLGQEVTVEVRLGLSKPRYFSGIVCEVTCRGMAGRYVVYEAVLRPWIWLLSRKTNCRIFQNETSLDIVRKLFKEHDPQWFEVKLFNTLKSREYCVQYRESDFHFVSRLLEDEGIYYFFQHELGKHTLMLVDSSSAHKTSSGFETINFVKVVDGAEEPVGVMLDWCATKRVVANKVTLSDFDFLKSRANLTMDGQNPKVQSNFEVYDYPGLYTEPDHGESRARLRVEELGLGFDVVKGDTNSRGLSTGYLFKLQEHPRKDQNREYLIIGARYQIESGSYESDGAAGAFQLKSSLTAIDSQTQFRPPRITPEPVLSGAQTAQVVGPEGQEIWTDSHARVKVQFHWDREGKHDESSSCWIRVAQMWAGAKWGSLHIPRIGQEVVVEFLEGNLDRPLIVGSVYNDANQPPYALPSKATQSGIKSHSTAKAGVDQFNELRFEDDKGKEEVLLNAQRNLTTNVKHDSKTTITNDHTHTVKKNMTVQVSEGDYKTTVSKGTLESHVPSAVHATTAKSITATAVESITFSVGQVAITIDTTSITLKVGEQTSIKLEAATLAVIAPMVNINS
jgi:type VI secretion system secreted protein VgrG